MITIAVTGYAESALPATRGTVRARVECEGASRAEVVAEAARIHRELSVRAAELAAAGATTRWNADSVSIGTTPTWGPDGVRGADAQRASSAFMLRFSDFGALQEWVDFLGAEAAVRIESLTWDVSERALAEATELMRARAVTDAVARAGVYAGAAGAGTPALTAIYEPGLRSAAPAGPGGAMMAKSMMMSADAAGGGSFDLTPREIQVSAEVTADFVA